MSLVTIYRTFSPADAHLIRSRLEAAELHASVADELAALTTEGYSLTTGGIRVQVPEEEAELARDLIAAKDSDAE